jgi:hypothetical protein
MNLTTRTFEVMYCLAITFAIVALLGCGNGSTSADTESPDRSATITFQLKINQPPNQSQNIPVNQAISEPDICNDYLIDTIGVQVFRTQDESVVATAEAGCAEHSITISNVPEAETLYLVCRGYVGGNPVWQGRVDDIVAVAGQNTDLGTIDLNYNGDNVAAPEVVSTFPAPNAADVDLNASIVVVFNEKLAPSSIPDQAITVLHGDIPVSGQVDYDSGSSSIRFLPANTFDAETTYTATLQSQSDDSGTITDTARNPFSGDVRWQFTTRGTVDDTAPQVIATSPPNGAADVALKASISAVFSEPMDPDSLTDSTFQLSSDQGTLSGQIAYDNQTRMLSMTPDSALNAGTTYTVVITTQARDLAQNPLSETYTWQFRSLGDGIIIPALTNLTVSAGAYPKTLHFSWDVDKDDDVDLYQLEVDADGASGFSVMADATDITITDCTVTIPVHLTDWFNALFRVVALDAADNQLAVSDETDLFNHVTAEEVIGFFKASNTGAADRFGTSVSLSADGNTLAVGAYREASAATSIGGDQHDNSANESGAVYLFTRNAANVWSQQAYVKASNTGGGDFFGSSVALSDDGNTLAVGATGEASATTDIGGDQEDNSAGESGAVYLFTRNAANVWSQQAYVKASNTDSTDKFGSSVAISADGHTLAVGATGEASAATGIGGNQDDNSAGEAGAVYLFTRNAANVWSQQAYVKASNTDSMDGFGWSVALSADGNILVVGAVGEDSAATGIGGNQDDNYADRAGAVYLFTRNAANAWSQQAYVKASNTDSMDGFGSSVALSDEGNTLAVGAYGEASAATGIGGNQDDNNADRAGAVYLFTRNAANAWSQQDYVKASNTGEGDAFGSSVALSDDVNTLAVAAFWENSAATGINGNLNDSSAIDSGAVYLY